MRYVSAGGPQPADAESADAPNFAFWDVKPLLEFYVPKPNEEALEGPAGGAAGGADGGGGDGGAAPKVHTKCKVLVLELRSVGQMRCVQEMYFSIFTRRSLKARGAAHGAGAGGASAFVAGPRSEELGAALRAYARRKGKCS